MQNRNLIVMLNSIANWLRSASGLDQIALTLSKLNRAIVAQSEQLTQIQGILMTLAEKIKMLVAVETEEGRKLQEANAKLTDSLASAKETIARLEGIASTVPGLQAEVETLKTELSDASLAADEIAAINPTPVSDGVIDEVKENPEIETPPVVADAPLPSPEVILPVEVVEAAIDAIVDAE